MSEINYTVIIPHKNIPGLLRRCLDSIPKREDIQVVVVDDNSDPLKVDFHHFPGLGEKGIEVCFTKEGKGAGYARNTGMQKACGRWLLFADADDFYTDAAWMLLDEYVGSDADIVYFPVRCVDSVTLEPADRRLSTNAVIEGYLREKQENNGRNEMENKLRYTCWEPWNKMFRRKFVFEHRLVFEEIVRGNDAMFVVKAGHYAERIAAGTRPLYTVTYRPGSLTYLPEKSHKESSFLLKIRLNRFYRSVKHPEYRQSVLYDIKEAYTLFGWKEAVRYLKIIIMKRADFFCFLTDWAGFARMLKRLFR